MEKQNKTAHNHDGHFQRLTQKFELGALQPHEVIELMIHQIVPRVNTNEQAHALIETSGGFCEMFNRSEESLLKVKGVGKKTALNIRLISEIIKIYLLEQCDTSRMLKNPEDLHNYLRAIYVGSYEETGYMLMFGKSGKFLGYEEIGKGLRNQGVISMKRAVNLAHKAGAAAVIIAHNHPDGIPVPSDVDGETSKKLDIGFGNAGMRIHEHYVVAAGRCIPFSDKVHAQK